MKQILVAYILPFFIAVAAVFFLGDRIAQNLMLYFSLSKEPTFRYIDNFENNSACESKFLASYYSEIIFLLGSSELTNETDAIPYNFISNHFSTQVSAVGHAGNQCFSIYSQLLANQERLTNAPIIIILSPMWFQSDNALGTTSKIFLEFNSEHFLNKINADNSLPEFKAYENQRLSELYKDLTSPSLPLKQMHFEHEASKSFLHKAMYAPLIFSDKLLLAQKMKLIGFEKPERNFSRIAIQTDSIQINWDSLFAFSKKDMLDHATNNAWGIGNEYFDEHIHGNTSTIKIIQEKYNKELADLKMLLKLLKAKKANARFIILPMNPYYYTNLQELSPLINSIETDLRNDQFECLNFWVTDTSKYEKGILRDVMHLSDYGWHKVNKFIVETYHLNK